MIGKRLAELRDEAGLSQEALGYRAGIHGVHVNKLENNRVRSPGVATLQALADVLSEALGRPISVDDLLAEPETAQVGVAGVAADGEVGAGRGFPAAPAGTSPAATPPPPSRRSS